MTSPLLSLLPCLMPLMLLSLASLLLQSLAEEAGWLREECMRLTQENMQLQE